MITEVTVRDVLALTVGEGPELDAPFVVHREAIHRVVAPAVSVYGSSSAYDPYYWGEVYDPYRG
ncbi:MAG: hypothetical protein AAGD38_14970, partial [Acidobacteriota bacterium]